MEFETYEGATPKEKAYFSKKITILHLLVLIGMILYMTAGGSICGYFGCLAVLMFFLREDIKIKDAVAFRKKMTAPTFFMLLTLSFILHFAAIVTGELLNPILANFGVQGETMKQFFEGLDADYSPTPLSEILYGGFMVPLIEETICRGFIMGEYHITSGSKVHAIFFSTLIFACMHCDILNVLPFFLGGAVLAYTAMEYGIVWSAILHSALNFLTGEMFQQRLLMEFPYEMRYPIYFAASALVALGCIVIIIVKRRSITEYISENACEKYQFLTTLISPPLIFLILLLFVLAVMKLDQI